VTVRWIGRVGAKSDTLDFKQIVGQLSARVGRGWARLSASKLNEQPLSFGRPKFARLLAEHSLHISGADAEFSADLEHAVTLALNSRIRCSTAGLTRRRPNFVPFALARTSPALTRSQIMPRSNSANTSSILNMALPAVVVVSSPC